MILWFHSYKQNICALSLIFIPIFIILFSSHTTVEFSLEVQKTGDGKWHIPAADGITWLCMGDVTRPLLLPNGSISNTPNISDNPFHNDESSCRSGGSGSGGSGSGGVVSRMAPRVLPSRYSAPSWKRKYFNALNPFIFDDILHPSDLSIATSTSNTTSNSATTITSNTTSATTSISITDPIASLSPPLNSTSNSDSTLSSSSHSNFDSHSHSDLSSCVHPSSSLIETASNKSKSIDNPVDTVGKVP